MEERRHIRPEDETSMLELSTSGLDAQPILNYEVEDVLNLQREIHAYEKSQEGLRTGTLLSLATSVALGASAGWAYVNGDYETGRRFAVAATISGCAPTVFGMSWINNKWEEGKLIETKKQAIENWVREHGIRLQDPEEKRKNSDE